MGHKKKRSNNNFVIFFVGLLIAITLFLIYVVTYNSPNTTPSPNIFAATISPYQQSQQQGTFDLITPTPGPTKPVGNSRVQQPIGPTNTRKSTGPVTPGVLPTGGAAGPNDPFYCIDDEDPDGCDDQTAFHVPKGSGGPAGQCGSIMENAHKIVSSLPQVLKGFRDSINPAISNSCHDTGTYSSGYLSTFFVIDSFNLSGFKELSKTNASQVSGAGLLSWWKSAPAGYGFIPYSPTLLQQHASGQQNLTGCVVFINMPSGGVHVGIFNVLQLVNSNGDGVMSILQSGARYFIDRFPVVGWDVKNTPLHQTNISGIAGFGCHL